MAIPAADRLAIEELVHRHSWLIDHGQAGRLPELFTEDASLIGVGPDKHGRAAIAAWATAREAMGDRRSRHLNANVVLDPVAPDEVRGTVALTLYRHDGPGPGSAAPLAVAEYADIYRKGADGAWRFAERRLAVVFGTA